MKIKEVLNALEMFAPLPLQDDFDNAGLQVGLTDAEVTGALLCLDVTEAVVNEAVALGYNLIISHHPLIFKGYKSVSKKNYVERCIINAIKNEIVIYSMHTNLDNAFQGVNYKVSEKMVQHSVRVLDTKENMQLKLVTYVPVKYAENVRNALFDSGCGCIGNYDSCSYNTEGMGTFRAGKNTHPFCGEQGSLHEEKEIRIETVFPVYRQDDVVRTLLKVHPYEEPAFDLYPLQNRWKQVGSGIVGELEFQEPESDFLKRIKQLFEVGCVKHSRYNGRLIQKVALCGGAGAFLLPKAVKCHADVFITGEVKYHEYFNYENDILIAEIGHYESEQYTKDLIYSILKDRFPALEIKITHINTNPIKYL